MSLPAKLQKWVEAGLVTAEQRARILDHEQGAHAHRWKHGVVSVGLFSILLGIALIIAANWQEISWQLKLGTHFAVNAALTAFIWRWRHDHTRDNHREVALFALWGLTLTLIALMGQVFQLGGHAYTALRVWFWLTTPMILLFAQSTFTARLWAIAFVFYVPYDLIASTWDLSTNWNIRNSILLGTAIFVPFAGWVLGAWPRFAVNRPTMTRTLRRTSIFLALLAASIAGIEFYDHMAYGYSLAIPAVFAAGIIALRFYLQRKPFAADDRNTIDLLALAGLFICVPYLAPVVSPALAMVHFIAFWLLVGALWQDEGRARLVSLAIGVITLRLFIGFIELFGSMMMSGLGFILMGVVLLALVQVARRFDRRLKGRQA